MSGTNSIVPYIGSHISLISNAEIKYEGILDAINTQEATIALRIVTSHDPATGNTQRYDYITFRGTDIKDITVLESKKERSPGGNNNTKGTGFVDPAIMSVGKGGGAPTATSKGSNFNNADKSYTNKNSNKGSGKSYSGSPQQYNNNYNTSSWNNGGGKGKGGYNNNYNNGGGYNNNYYNSNYKGYNNWNQKGGKSKGKGKKGKRGNVGELVPGRGPKTKFDEDYDFTAQAELDKNDQEEKEEVKQVYDAKKSFFDNLSSAASKRDEPVDREAIRKVDMETFGQTFFSKGNRGKGGGKNYKGKRTY